MHCGSLLDHEFEVSLSSNERGASNAAGALGLRFEYEYFLR